MRLYIKQKVFQLVKDFPVKDEAGNDRYQVQGRFMSMASRMAYFV